MDSNMQEAKGGEKGDQPKPILYQHHTLHFQFPAFQLLPKGKRPFIERPTRMADREKPEFSALGLHADDVEIYVRMKSDHGVHADMAMTSIKDDETPSLGEPIDLAACIHRLTIFAGVSHLYFVSYVEDDDVLTRFELTTHFYTTDGQLIKPDRGFELGSAEVNRLIKSLSKKEEWVTRLADLVYGSSDRAYLCRKMLMLNYNTQWTADVEKSWGVEWDETPWKPVRQLFADRLLMYHVNDADEIDTEPLGELAECHNEMMRVQLPCEHIAVLPAYHIQNTPSVELLSAACETCGKRIMSAGDDRTLRMHYARLHRYNWEDSMEYWANKHKKVRNDARMLDLPVNALVDSLIRAKNSFVMPMTVNPRSLCLASQPEANGLLDKLISALREQATVPAMTPARLFTVLNRTAWTIIGAPFGDNNGMLMNAALPPGFDGFVQRWLTRAVNDVVGRQADDGDDAELMEMVGKMEKTRLGADPAVKKVESDLEEIAKMFGEASLQGLEEAAVEEEGEEEL